jgi:hypothetical protein
VGGRAEDAASSNSAVKGDGEQDLERGEANDDVFVGPVGANAEAGTEGMGEFLGEVDSGGCGEVVGGVSSVDVKLGVGLS